MKNQIAVLSLVFLLTGCDWVETKLPDSWSQTSKGTNQEKTSGRSWEKSSSKRIDPLVPWKGGAIAADTFIRISKQADLGVVNIGTTKIIQPRQNPFGMGPQGSPFDQFFNDDLFKFFFGDPRQQPKQKEHKQQSLGSGFIISEDGLIVTNNHVIDQADEIKVTIGSDQEFIATVVGTDPKTDVALIKINPKGQKLNTLALGDSDALEVGEIVVAIGNPFGLSHTVTQGIVSAKERTIGFGPYDNFIQTDASINPGNSGGPLLNLQAEVVGINAAIHATGQGIGFAIPINLAKNILPQLEADGSVTRGWLGVYIQPMDEVVAKSLGLSKPEGALVAKVQNDSPASQAGIEAGDVIIEVDGKKVKNSTELPRMVAGIEVGKKVDITLMRNKKKQTVSVTVGKLEDEEVLQKNESSKDLPSDVDKIGLRVREVTQADQKRLGLENQKGIIIEDIEMGSSAHGRGLEKGNLIIELNQQVVTDVKSYQAIVKKLKTDDPVMMKVVQDAGSTLFVVFSVQ